MTQPSMDTPSNASPWGFDTKRLDAWLRANVSGADGEMTLEPIAGGLSNPTFFVTYPARRMVLRKRPAGPLLPSAHAVDREHRFMDAIASTGVPVPRMVAFHGEPDVVGTAFYVMERLDGRIFSDCSMPGKTWDRLERHYAALFEARDADTGQRVRLMMAALIRARREHTYEIDAASLMLASEHWIPIEGVHELSLIHALVEQHRRFVKPLRYDAKSGAAFPNALLLDAGAVPVALHVVSAFIDPKEQRAKERAVADSGATTWAWSTATQMPSFPQAIAR